MTDDEADAAIVMAHLEKSMGSAQVNMIKGVSAERIFRLAQTEAYGFELGPIDKGLDKPFQRLVRIRRAKS